MTPPLISSGQILQSAPAFRPTYFYRFHELPARLTDAHPQKGSDSGRNQKTVLPSSIKCRAPCVRFGVRELIGMSHPPSHGSRSAMTSLSICHDHLPEAAGRWPSHGACGHAAFETVDVSDPLLSQVPARFNGGDPLQRGGGRSFAARLDSVSCRAKWLPWG